MGVDPWGIGLRNIRCSGQDKIETILPGNPLELKIDMELFKF